MSQSNRFDLSGRVALVTGAARGIGRAVALALAEQGADVVVHDLDEAGAALDVAQAIGRLGRRAWVMGQDLVQTDRLGDLARRAWAAADRIDILVNNAGTAYLEHFDEISPEHWRRVMAVNLDAPFFLSQAIARRMIEAKVRGRIINITSKNGLVAEAGLAHYNASKGGLELLTQSLAIELGAYGITVNAIAPGSIQTDIGAAFNLDPAFNDYRNEHIPLEHRLGRVEEIAAAAVFLASDAAAYMTGQHMVIDGGALCQQMPRLQFMRPSSARPAAT